MTADALIGRCFELRRNRPRQALDLAGTVLSDPALDVERRIKALSCQGVAANVVGEDASAVAIADRIAVDLERHPQLPDEYRLRALSNLGAILHGAGQIYRAEQVYAQTLEVGARLGGPDAVRIHRGVGGAAFARAERVDVVGAKQLAVADVDGDGSLDVVVAAQGGLVRVDPAAGTGADRLALDFDPLDVTAADLDGDDRMDLAVLDASTGRLVAWLQRP